MAWRGHKRHLRLNLRKAKTYEEWAEAAGKLDNYLGFDEWKGTEEDSYFDHTLVSGPAVVMALIAHRGHKVRRVRRTLIRLRASKDTRGLMDALSVCVRSNFAGSEGVKMYSEVRASCSFPV